MTARRKTRKSFTVVNAPGEGPNLEESPAPGPVTTGSRTHPSGNAWGRIGEAVKLLLGVLSVVGMSAGAAWGAHRYALNSPRFAVRTIEVDGQRQRGDSRIAELAGLQLGQNLFQTDTDAAERRLLSDPWVEKARVLKELPSTLRVELTEREASALALIAGDLFLVAQDAKPFKRLEPTDPHDMPVITGISPENLARDRDRELERIATGLEILRQFERIELSRVYPAQEVHVGEGGEVVLTVGKAALSLHLGVGEWRRKLLMAARVVGRLARAGQTPAHVYLDNSAHPERVVVRMR